MRKFSVFLLILFALQVTTSPFLMGASNVYAQETRFNDVKTTDWFYDNVMQLVQDKRSIIQGYGDGTFRPDAELTFEAFVTMVVRAAGFTLDEPAGDWSKLYMEKAEELGFLDAYVYRKMAKNAPITREQMCPMIVKCLEYLEGPLGDVDYTKVNQVVMDSTEIRATLLLDVQKTYMSGIIMGYESDNTFRPHNVLNRAEAATVIIRIIDKAKRETFDFDALYAALYGDFASQLKGGSDWVDPKNVTWEESIIEDMSLLTSDMSYGPDLEELSYSWNIQQSIDEVRGTLVYSSLGAYAGHIEDYTRLLQRRLNADEIEFVLDYLGQKTSDLNNLPYQETAIYLKESNYLLKFYEFTYWPGQSKEFSPKVSFNIYYRDENFVNEYEDYIAIATEGNYIHYLEY